MEHYVIRCQNNIKILNHIDLINRTSEFARLYGILFYSVISRGSQVGEVHIPPLLKDDER